MQVQFLDDLVFDAPLGAVDVRDRIKAASDLRDLVELTLDALDKEKKRR